MTFLHFINYCNDLKLGLHVRFISYDSIQACSFISHRLEMYSMTQRKCKRIGQANRLD